MYLVGRAPPTCYLWRWHRRESGSEAGVSMTNLSAGVRVPYLSLRFLIHQ